MYPGETAAQWVKKAEKWAKVTGEMYKTNQVGG